jgi:hypothetical protein
MKDKKCKKTDCKIRQFQMEAQAKQISQLQTWLNQTQTVISEEADWLELESRYVRPEIHRTDLLKRAAELSQERSDLMEWTHNICEACWELRSEENGEAGRIPTRMRYPKLEHCCFCGKGNADGIFVRENPRSEKLHCIDDHEKGDLK